MEDSCGPIGPLTCSLDCRPDEESDTESYVTTTKNNSSGRSIVRRRAKSLAAAAQPFDDPATRRDILRHRIEDFRTKGWLTQQEHRKYIAFLSSLDNMTDLRIHRPGDTMNSNDAQEFSGTHGIKELEVELDLVEGRLSGNKPTWRRIMTPTRASTTKKERVAKATSPASFANLFSNKTTATTNNDDKNDSNGRPLATATHRYMNQGSTEPQQPKSQQARTIVSPNILAETLNEHNVSELFVETCFFARLGFIQPPCCMQCTYKESMMSAIPQLSCPRWVVWRRNANQTLHPKHMANNAIVVQCQSARKLVAGKFVEGYKWDKVSKILVEPPAKNRTCSI